MLIKVIKSKAVILVLVAAFCMMFFAGCGGGGGHHGVGSTGTGDITGLIIDGRSGRGIANAQVSVLSTGMAVKTGSDGSYTLKGVGSGQVTLETSDGQDTRTAAVMVPLNSSTNKSIVLHKDTPVTIQGRVINVLTGEPIAEAAVEIADRQYTSESDGSIVATGVSSGVQWVSITKSGYEALSASVLSAEIPQYTWYLIPNTNDLGDATFQEYSEQAFQAASALRTALSAMRVSTVNIQEGSRRIEELTRAAQADMDLSATLQASRALANVLMAVSEYNDQAGSRGLFGWLDFGANASRFSKGADESIELKNRVFAGEDVPEVNAWLAQNPIGSYSSLQEIRNDFGDDAYYMYNNVVTAYLTANPNSPFNQDVVGAGKDVIIGTYESQGANLIGDGLNGIWSGLGTLITEVKDALQFISKNGKQYIWGIETAQGKLVLIETKPGQPTSFPSGTFDLIVSNGTVLKPTSLSSFSLTAGASRTISASDEVSSRQVAVTPACYDDIGSLLVRVGVSYDTVNMNDILNWSGLAGYDIVCVNCSYDISPMTSEGASRLRNFVNLGGILYCSDWAYEIVRDAFPDMLTFFEDAKIGNEQTVSGRVVNSSLAQYLGKNSLGIVYDLSGWVPIRSVAADVNVDIYGSVLGLPETSKSTGIHWHSSTGSRLGSNSRSLGELPLSVTFSYGKGKVHYTTFHNEAQATEDIQRMLLYHILTK
ncbi:MAG: carboxypeptidase regulatory-like domain-containing protein [Armatimonadota bacterium]|nr:hypothetical protein [bacterium]